MLVVAEDAAGDMVAGALNLVGSDAIYGRNWGCAAGADYKGLHFETCYYQVGISSYLDWRVYATGRPGRPAGLTLGRGASPQYGQPPPRRPGAPLVRAAGRRRDCGAAAPAHWRGQSWAGLLRRAASAAPPPA